MNTMLRFFLIFSLPLTCLSQTKELPAHRMAPPSPEEIRQGIFTPPHLSRMFSNSGWASRALPGSQLSDSVQVEWVRHYTSGLVSSSDYLSDIAIDTLGNIYATGQSNQPITAADFLTIKYDNSGQPQWTARFDGGGIDVATTIAIDDEGNIYVAGYSWNMGKGYDFLTIKYNTDGQEMWTARYNGSDNLQDMPVDIGVDAQGNIFVTGSGNHIFDKENDNGSTGADYLTVKYDPSGNEQWAAYYSGYSTSSDEPAALTIDPQQNIVVTGTSLIPGSENDYLTVKYDQNGNELWSARYDGPGNTLDYAEAITHDEEGYIYVTGGSYGAGTAMDFATVVYDSNGVEQRVSRLHTAQYDDEYAVDIAIDAHRNVYVTGYADIYNAGSDFLTVKYDANGVERWIATYNNPDNGDDWPIGLRVDGEGSVLVGGYSYGLSTREDFAAVKYDSNGVELWSARYNGSANSGDRAATIALDGQNNAYIAGSSRESGTWIDYTIVKYSPTGVEQMVSHYNGPGTSDDHATDMIVDDMGNIYVTGRSKTNGNFDYLTLKYDASGNEIWQARYNGPSDGDDEAAAIVLDGNGNVYITGKSEGDGTGFDYATVQYNPAGAEQWVMRYDGPAGEADEAAALAFDGNSGIVVTGKSTGVNTGDDIATIKYTTTGTEAWSARFHRDNGSFQDDHANAVALDSEGNIYVAGESGRDYITIKYNPAGSEEWSRIYTRFSSLIFHDEANDVAVDDQGNIYVTGTSQDTATTYDIATIKYNPGGNMKWIARYNRSGFSMDQGLVIGIDSHNNVYVNGKSNSSSGVFFITVKYDSAGIEQWATELDGNPGTIFSHKNPFALTIDDDNSIYIAGYSSVNGSRNFVTVKYTPPGEKEWVALYEGPAQANDIAVAVNMDGEGNVIVAGTSDHSDWSAYTTIKYSQTPTGVISSAGKLPATYWLGQNFPNPFNPATTIEFALPEASHVKLEVFNILGQRVKTLVDQRTDAGVHRVQWNAARLASGVYIYRISTDDYLKTRKMLLLK